MDQESFSTTLVVSIFCINGSGDVSSWKIISFVDPVFSWIVKSTEIRIDGNGGLIVSFVFVE